MKNLMKYEIIRMKNGLLLSLAAIFLMEIGIVVCIAADREESAYIFASIMAMIFVFLIIGTAVAILMQYSADVNRKSGYMLFMTPNSYYKIVGSKILTSMVLVIGLIVLGVLIAVADGFIAAAKYGELVSLDLIGASREIGSAMSVKGTMSVLGQLVMVFFGWMSIFTPVFFVMTLNKAYFSGWKLRGVISFVLFLVLTGFYGSIEERAMSLMEGRFAGAEVITGAVFTAILAVGCFIGTVKILEKKLAL